MHLSLSKPMFIKLAIFSYISALIQVFFSPYSTFGFQPSSFFSGTSSPSSFFFYFLGGLGSLRPNCISCLFLSASIMASYCFLVSSDFLTTVMTTTKSVYLTPMAVMTSVLLVAFPLKTIFWESTASPLISYIFCFSYRTQIILRCTVASSETSQLTTYPFKVFTVIFIRN